ncbi:MAG: hypothetical protein ACP6IS_06735 [Candidatus Asgardarchaeia archaeon]
MKKLEEIITKIESVDSRISSITKIYRKFNAARKELETFIIYYFSELLPKGKITLEELNYNVYLLGMIKQLAQKYNILVSSSDDYVEIKKWGKVPSFEYLENSLITQIIDELIHSFKTNPSTISIASPKFKSLLYRISIDPFFVALMFSVVNQMDRLIKFDALNKVIIFASEFIYFPLILSEILENTKVLDIVSFNTRNAALLDILLMREVNLYVDSFDLKKIKASRKKYDAAIAFLPFQFAPFLQDIDALMHALSNIANYFIFYQPTIGTVTSDMFIFSFFTDLTFVQKDDITSFLISLGANVQSKDNLLWFVDFKK